MSTVRDKSIKENDDNMELITILSEPKNFFDSIYPCVNGYHPKLPNSRVLMTGAYVEKKNILFHKKLYKKKNSRKKRYQWHITIKYNRKQWNYLKNWKHHFAFDIYITNYKENVVKKCSIVYNLPIMTSDIPHMLRNDDINEYYQSSFNRCAVQVKKVNSDLYVLKFMLEDAAWF